MWVSLRVAASSQLPSVEKTCRKSKCREIIVFFTSSIHGAREQEVDAFFQKLPQATKAILARKVAAPSLSRFGDQAPAWTSAAHEIQLGSPRWARTSTDRRTHSFPRCQIGHLRFLLSYWITIMLKPQYAMMFHFKYQKMQIMITRQYLQHIWCRRVGTTTETSIYNLFLEITYILCI